MQCRQVIEDIELAKVKPVMAMAVGSKRWNTSEELLMWLEAL